MGSKLALVESYKAQQQKNKVGLLPERVIKRIWQFDLSYTDPVMAYGEFNDKIWICFS